MPQPTATAILQLCLLLSAIPIQYFICQWYGTNSAERLKIIERTINFWDNFKQSYMSLDAWLDQAKIWKAKARAWYIADPLQSENPSSEGDEDNYYFAESNEIRSPKPKVVKFSVGQVIVHRIFGYSGVIIGWDVKAKAPAEWLNQKYREDKEEMGTSWRLSDEHPHVAGQLYLWIGGTFPTTGYLLTGQRNRTYLQNMFQRMRSPLLQDCRFTILI
ncbi:uncharacterized protein [Ambystoma mexicanum]|uniref:uncharacterized protein n=1 Tax=Ambystoma mexicanum TaxID=8296 RepID=UPI0037E99088